MRSRWPVVVVAALCAACATPKGASVEDKRRFVDEQTARTLEQFYEARPQLRQQIASAGGYAVFSTVQVKVLLLGSGHGYGVARRGAERTYMRMAQLGAGPGLGATDMRVLFVFHDAASFRHFVDRGYEFAGKAEAAATSGGAGLAVGASGAAASSGVGMEAGGKVGDTMAASKGIGMDVYRLTQAGLALQAQVAGTKYWKDGGLN